MPAPVPAIPPVITIVFAGIAAITNNPPDSNISRSIIFPAAVTGSYTTANRTVTLMKHKTYLYVPYSSIAPGSTTQEKICNRAGGTLHPIGSSTPSSQVCKIPLAGAKLWVLPGAADSLVTEDDTFRSKVPSFSNYCSSAKDLPVEYTSDNPATGDPYPQVAARFDILGGKLSACTRSLGAVIAKLALTSSDNALYIRQNQRTTRILLNPGASMTIYNKPEPDMVMMPESEDGSSHFGWYYTMNGRASSTELCEVTPPPTPTTATSNTGCPLPGVDDLNEASASAGAAASSANCSISNWP